MLHLKTLAKLIRGAKLEGISGDPVDGLQFGFRNLNDVVIIITIKPGSFLLVSYHVGEEISPQNLSFGNETAH